MIKVNTRSNFISRAIRNLQSSCSRLLHIDNQDQQLRLHNAKPVIYDLLSIKL